LARGIRGQIGIEKSLKTSESLGWPSGMIPIVPPGSSRILVADCEAQFLRVLLRVPETSAYPAVTAKGN
jgi:hypothetical protein